MRRTAVNCGFFISAENHRYIAQPAVAVSYGNDGLRLTCAWSVVGNVWLGLLYRDKNGCQLPAG